MSVHRSVYLPEAEARHKGWVVSGYCRRWIPALPHGELLIVVGAEPRGIILCVCLRYNGGGVWLTGASLACSGATLEHNVANDEVRPAFAESTVH